MKRIANILTISVAAFIFMFFYQTVSLEQYHSVNQFISSFPEATGKEHASIAYELYDEEGNETFHKLIDFLKEHDYDALTSTETRRYDFISDYTYYIHTKENFNDLDFFKSMNGRDMDFTLNDGSYYSSFIDEDNAMDIIDYINRSYHKEYQPRLTIKQFEARLEDSSSQTNVTINFYGENTNKITSDIRNSEISNHVTVYNHLTFMEPTDAETSNIEAISILLILSIASLIVITICDLIREKKEITIRKLFGESDSSIYLNLIAKRYLFNLVLYIATQILLYAVIIRGIRPIHLLLLKPLLFVFGMYIAFWILANLISYFVLTRVGRATNLKQSSSVRFTNSIALAIKLLLIVLMITPFINLFTTAPLTIEENYILRKNEDKMLGNLAIEGYYMDDTEDILSGNEALSITLDLFEELNWVYHDFYANDLPPEDYLQELPEEVIQEQFIHHPYIVVNEAYLKDYDIRDLGGNTLDYDTLEHNTLLVPETYKDEEFTDVYYDSPTHNTIYIQDGGTFYNYYPFNIDIEDLREHNPLILFKNHLDENISWNGSALSIRDEGDTQDIINDFLTDNNLRTTILISSMDDVYNTAISRSNDQLFNLVMTLCLYILMIIIFQYQTVYVYFSESKEEIAVNYLFGKTYIQRYGPLILKSIIIYIVPLILGIGLFEIQYPYMLMYVVFGIALDLIVSTIMIRSFEKKRTLSVLKGE